MLKEVVDLGSVLDVGCGDGRWLRQCAGLGAETIVGVDGPWTDRQRLLVPAESVVIRDVSAPFELSQRFDLAISLEVAEHVGPESAEQFVANMVAHSDCVLFGAAIPYQGGYRHVNERWLSYWAGLYDDRGYRAFDLFRKRLWNMDSVHVWYKQNMLLYVNRKCEEKIETIERYISENNVSELPLDIVHPERYEAIASYDQIAFKPLLRKFPARALDKSKGILLGRT